MLTQLHTMRFEHTLYCIMFVLLSVLTYCQIICVCVKCEYLV